MIPYANQYAQLRQQFRKDSLRCERIVATDHTENTDRGL